MIGLVKVVMTEPISMIWPTWLVEITVERYSGRKVTKAPVPAKSVLITVFFSPIWRFPSSFGAISFEFAILPHVEGKQRRPSRTLIDTEKRPFVPSKAG